ncbi:hypothetical protein Tco_0719375 [Tanacetum coccineum]
MPAFAANGLLKFSFPFTNGPVSEKDDNLHHQRSLESYLNVGLCHVFEFAEDHADNIKGKYKFWESVKAKNLKIQRIENEAKTSGGGTTAKLRWPGGGLRRSAAVDRRWPPLTGGSDDDSGDGCLLILRHVAVAGQ